MFGLRGIEINPISSCVCVYFQCDEVYIIVRAVKDTTVYCLATNEATAEGGLPRVFLLLTNTMEPTHQLQVLHVPAIGQEDVYAPMETLRSHDALIDIGRNTRETSRSDSCRATGMAYTTALMCSTTQKFPARKRAS